MTENKNYERSIIKLGNSMAVTFPQDWFTKTHLKEHSKVHVFPIDEDTLIIHGNNYKEGESIMEVNLHEWPTNLAEQLVLTAFKLNVDQLHLKCDVEKYKKEYYDLVNKLQRKIIGFDSSIVPDNKEICIRFLIDSTKTSLPDILIELYKTLGEFINSVLDSSSEINQDIYKERFSRKYYMGLRALLQTLLKYPSLKDRVNRPIVRTLGDRITLLYAKELKDYASQLINLPKEILNKYSKILVGISELLLKIVEKYNKDDQENILLKLQTDSDNIYGLFNSLDFKTNENEMMIRGIISRFFSISKDLIGISITRILEAKL